LQEFLDSLLPERKDSSGCDNLFSGRGKEKKKRVEGFSSVMPEIFYQASKSFKNIWIPDRGIQGQAKNGLKIAGVTRRWESTFLLFLFVLSL